jgi:group I intron endonuclease
MEMKEQDNKQYIIYKATNSYNNMVYIGATSSDLESRKKEHLYSVEKDYSTSFHNAISTYGMGAFEWEQIDTTDSSDELAQKEKFYISEYDSKNEGYNSDEGGGFKKTIYQYDTTTGELIKTFDCLQNAANAINATKQDISKTCLSVNKLRGGFYWSYEYKEPFIPSRDKRRKKIIQFSLDGQYVAEYDSVANASLETGVNISSIAKVCRGERNRAGGFNWQYTQK